MRFWRVNHKQTHRQEITVANQLLWPIVFSTPPLDVKRLQIAYTTRFGHPT